MLNGKKINDTVLNMWQNLLLLQGKESFGLNYLGSFPSTFMILWIHFCAYLSSIDVVQDKVEFVSSLKGKVQSH